MPLSKKQIRLIVIRRNYAKKKASSSLRFAPAESRILREVARIKAKLKDKGLSVYGVPVINAGEHQSSEYVSIRAKSAKEAEDILHEKYKVANSNRDVFDCVYIDGSRQVIGEQELKRINDSFGLPDD